MHGSMARPNAEDRERRFDRIYAGTYAPMRAYTWRRCDPYLAQDIVAETFLAARRNRGGVVMIPNVLRARGRCEP
jgi:DNA-directed RNA polymerase specialized sigma24 family protein